MTEYVEIGKYNTRNDVYHTTDCNRCPENAKTWTREKAEQQGLRECKFCAGVNEQPDNRDTQAFKAAVQWEPDQ